MKVKLSKIQERLPEFEIIHFQDVNITGVSYDSRTIEKGDIFFPLEGENFNGHDFIPQAFNNGAVVTICDSEHLAQYVDRKEPIIVVDSIEEGLEKIVNVIFSDITAPKVAITGSTGKTTTREMLVKILESKGKVLNSDRNYNTLWGNAKVLSEYDGHDYIILEFAMDRKGEIGWQCRAIDPDLGVILNIGYVHAENVGGIRNVYETKKDLADYLHRSGKPLVLNADDNWLKKIEAQYTYQLLTYGREGKDFRLIGSDVSLEGTQFTFEHEGQEYTGFVKAYGKDLAYNALAAISLADLLGVDVKDSVKALKEYTAFGGRFEIKELNEYVTLVNDAYNANPTSMKMAIETFDDIFDKSEYDRVLILGDMKELGKVTQEQHRLIGELVKRKNFTKVYYVGDYYKDFGLGEKLINWYQAEVIVERIKRNVRKKTAVLLKSSHSVGLYNIEK
jgi:UDP-N-acetylmuramoyl-tripeptide--D-alanyl-D-alanine ligase